MEHKFEPFQKVLVRDLLGDKWHCDFFSDIDEYGNYVCCGGVFCMCLPYEENEHLLGTTDSPTPKHEYRWGDKVEVKLDNDIWVKAIYYEIIEEDCHKHRVFGYHQLYGKLSDFVFRDHQIRPLAKDSNE